MAKPTPRPPRPRYDIEQVRSAAASRWPEILSNVCAVDVDFLDGQEHPCPKCGGTDRFRYFNDGTGGAICNQCFRSQNGDGFSFVQWMDGNRDFLAAVAKVAEYIGITPEQSAPGKPGGKAAKKRKGKKNEETGEFEAADPESQLEFQPWNDSIVSLLWLPTKPPITLAALKRCHARLANCQQGNKHVPVIALPIWGEQLTAAKPVGWCLYHLGGKMLPRYTKNAKTGEYELTEELKVKVAYGSEPGLIGPVELLTDPGTTHVWKLEGPSDLLAWWSLQNIPAGHVAVTNANGARELPKEWMVDALEGKTVHVLHDADAPGMNGACAYEDDKGRKHPGWLDILSNAGINAVLVKLPYEVQPSHGKDLRDYINERVHT